MQWVCACSINKREATQTSNWPAAALHTHKTHTHLLTHTHTHTATEKQYERLLWHSLSHLVTRTKYCSILFRGCKVQQKLPRRGDCNDWRSHAAYSPLGLRRDTCAGAALLALRNRSTSITSTASSSSRSRAQRVLCEGCQHHNTRTISQYLFGCVCVGVCAHGCKRVLSTVNGQATVNGKRRSSTALVADGTQNAVRRKNKNRNDKRMYYWNCKLNVFDFRSSPQQRPKMWLAFKSIEISCRVNATWSKKTKAKRKVEWKVVIDLQKWKQICKIYRECS